MELSRVISSYFNPQVCLLSINWWAIKSAPLKWLALFQQKFIDMSEQINLEVLNGFILSCIAAHPWIS